MESSAQAWLPPAAAVHPRAPTIQLLLPLTRLHPRTRAATATTEHPTARHQRRAGPLADLLSRSPTLQALGEAASFKLDGGLLVLMDAGGNVRLVFEAQE